MGDPACARRSARQTFMAHFKPASPDFRDQVAYPRNSSCPRLLSMCALSPPIGKATRASRGVDHKTNLSRNATPPPQSEPACPAHTFNCSAIDVASASPKANRPWRTMCALGTGKSATSSRRFPKAAGAPLPPSRIRPLVAGQPCERVTAAPMPPGRDDAGDKVLCAAAPTELACLAHVRSKFGDARAASSPPRLKRRCAAPVRHLKPLTPSERHALRVMRAMGQSQFADIAHIASVGAQQAVGGERQGKARTGRKHLLGRQEDS